MKAGYVRAMAWLQRVCLWVSSLCVLIITLIVPWGVFTRYVLGYGSSWPEPMAILLMIVFAFFSAAVCYRGNLHIAVLALPNALPPRTRALVGWLAELCMIGVSLFMVIWGTALVETTWHQVIAEFPALSTGITYLPIPVGGAIVLLFIIERLWTGALFAPPEATSIASAVE